MDADERPLLVQLNWTTDNREGRFVLKRDQDSPKVESIFFQPSHCSSGVLVFKTPPNKPQENDQEKEKGGVIQNFKRSLSRKDKNKEKRKNKAAEGSEDEAG